MTPKHPVLETNAWRAARALVKQKIPFIIKNQHGETKCYNPESPSYNLVDLRYFFKISYELGDIITLEVAQ